MNLAAPFLFALACWLTAAAAQAAPLPDESPHRSTGVASCASSLCHGAVETWTRSRILQNEYVTWSRRDKHARAYSVLLDARSVEIAKKLRLEEPAHRAAVCLDCHAHNVPPERRGERFSLSDGVGCEACHGPAERYLTIHVQRGATREDNIAHGLYPTADPIARAELCLSCHIGNSRKFVSHRMMAAGHPRMSFELDTFTQIQPPHHRVPADHLWDGVRAWAIGQAYAAQRLLALLRDPRRGRDGLFPELVLFDCHACHHPMRERRDAGARLGLGPGVMRLNDSNLLMLRQIVRVTSPALAETYAAKVARFHRSVAGGSDALERAADLQSTISDLVPAIGRHRFAAADLGRVLLGLIEDGLAGEYSDYHGAEQAVMAIQSVADFMQKQRLLRAPAIAHPMRNLMSAVAHDEKYRPAAFRQALRDLKSGVEAAVK